MAEEKYKELERVLKALANRRRLGIVAYLKKKKEASVGDIANELSLSIKATSKHLGLLAGAGVLDKEQRGTSMFYCVSKELTPAARHIAAVL